MASLSPLWRRPTKEENPSSLPAQPSGDQFRSEQCGVAEQMEQVPVEIPVYSYDELKMYTNGFSAENFMGKTFSSNSLVYRGEIVDKESHLVRKVIVEMRKDEKYYDLKAWQNQLNALKDPTISSHPNVVKLQACCNDAGFLGLVYDCHALGTLHNLILDESFSWSKRMNVALQLARVLQFLHSQKQPLILLNFEPRSILVDTDFDPLIFGFGMAFGGVLGTLDSAASDLAIRNRPQLYLDPEFVLSGIMGPSCDVFSFGALLLTMITKSPEIVVDDMIYRAGKFFLKRFYLIISMNFMVRKNFREDGEYHTCDSAAVTILAESCVKVRKYIYMQQRSQRPGMAEVVSILERLRVVKRLGLRCKTLA